MLDAERLRRLEAETERIAREAATSWFRRYWKKIAGYASALVTAATLGYKGWEWLVASAEADVVQRQQGEAQKKAVETNTASLRVMRSDVETLGDRMDGVERKLESAATAAQSQLRLQLADPRVRRRVRADEQLKAAVEAALGSPIQEN